MNMQSKNTLEQSYINEGILFIKARIIIQNFIKLLYRMKALETEPYTQAEANRAAGIGSYIKPKSFTIKTQPDKETFNKIFENEPNKNAII